MTITQYFAIGIGLTIVLVIAAYVVYATVYTITKGVRENPDDVRGWKYLHVVVGFTALAGAAMAALFWALAGLGKLFTLLTGMS
jgi:hypothetical protein